MKNKAKEVQNRIDEMIAEKAKEVNAIETQINEAGAEIEKQKRVQHEAMQRTDAPAYRRAKEAIADAEAAMEMYCMRRDQIHAKEYISEQDSDAVINDLLKYEDDLAIEYEKAIKEPIERLQKIHDEYTSLVKETEKAIKRWTSEIHSYHHVPTMTRPDGSDRSEEPVPVHRIPYAGCDVSSRVEKALRAVCSDDSSIKL